MRSVASKQGHGRTRAHDDDTDAPLPLHERRDRSAQYDAMDPHEVLGIPADATPEDAAAAFRALAKRHHPDRGGGEDAMAQINAAYDLLRAAAWSQREDPRRPRPQPPAKGVWLPPAIRRALGPELLAALEPKETVWLVTPASTWASPSALLAASDRRLLWLLDDAVAGRVNWLRYGTIEAAEHTVRRPRRRVATLRVRDRSGRRFAFGDLRPATAATIAAHIVADAPA